MYNFHHDYTDFFDLSGKGQLFYQSVKSDFVDNFTTLLTEQINVDFDNAECIANTLWARMSNHQLYYHTPVHILSVLQDFQNLYSKDFEEVMDAFQLIEYHLAIWFHDSVYVVGAKKGVNERSSALFFESMITPYLNDINQIAAVNNLITVTSKHEDMNISSKNSIMLDLDIRNLAWGYDKFLKVSECVRLEYEQVYTTEEYRLGRLQFLQGLLDRPSIFRTKSIKEKFENQAVSNIEKIIQELT